MKTARWLIILATVTMLASLALANLPVRATSSPVYQEFPSLEALKEWLAQDDTDQHLFIVLPPGGGTVNLDGVCYWKALQLKRSAQAAGYDMDIQYTWVDGENVYHAQNTVVIQGQVYLIEPSTDEVRPFARIW